VKKRGGERENRGAGESELYNKLPETLPKPGFCAENVKKFNITETTTIKVFFILFKITP
jgi:hypothetical protein